MFYALSFDMVDYVNTALLESEKNKKLFSLIIIMDEHLKEQIYQILVPQE